MRGIDITHLSRRENVLSFDMVLPIHNDEYPCIEDRTCEACVVTYVIPCLHMIISVGNDLDILHVPDDENLCIEEYPIC